MPAQKRSLPNNLNDDDESSLHHRPKQSRSQTPTGDEPELPLQRREQQRNSFAGGREELESQEDDDEPKDSEGTPHATSQAIPRSVRIELAELRKDVQCPICLGIIKKTRTVMECLHRFCRECIDKSMRLGNNECPACRTHCPSRRSLRDDPNYDTIIAMLYPDIEKYEAEELAFHEEEKNRNKQIQASIAQIFQRQTEALNKRRSGKETQDAFTTRPQRSTRNAAYSRRRSGRTVVPQRYDENDDENDNNIDRDSSSNDERRAETRPRRRKKRALTRSSLPSSSAATNVDGGTTENDENRGISPSFAFNSERLAWGRGGARSHTRYGNSRNTRISKLVDHLRGLKENSDEIDIHLMLISLDTNSAQNLQQPHLCCPPTVSVKNLCEYVAGQITLRAEDIQVLALERGSSGYNKLALNLDASRDNLDAFSALFSQETDDLRVLGAEETLAGIKAICPANMEYLVLGYQRKKN
ncbi:hypothetical protein UlMin_020725 [Ulmus minor]